MNNFDYIFKYNNIKSKKKNRILISKEKYIVCDIKRHIFDATAIKQIISFIESLNFNLKRFPIVFRFVHNILLSDKLSYVIFECICYNLIEQGYTVFVDLKCEHDIRTCGIECAPINLLSKGNCEKFIKKFQYELYENHFCKLITEKTKSNPAFLSIIYGDIDCFLRNAGINDSKRDEISQTISELIGNACEHTSSDCYIDIDIADDYYKYDENRVVNFAEKYYGVNIVILNFSDNLLGEDIKNRIINNNITIDRYNKLLSAYAYHKQFFNDKYTEQDFFNIAVFQNKISGSLKKEELGGTGLTCLINSLQRKSDSDDCYVLSGNKIVLFLKEYLSYNDDWIGFNKSNDFFSDTPDYEVFDRSQMYFSGTAYNLNFVMKSEDNNE